MLKEVPKDQKEASGPRVKQVDRGCQGRRETSGWMEIWETPALWDTAE